MSWVDEAKKKRELAQNAAEQEKRDRAAEFTRQKAEFDALMMQYDEIVARVLTDVGDAIWGNRLFSSRYEISFKRSDIRYDEKSRSFVGSADWYIYSKRRTIESGDGCIGKLHEGWIVYIGYRHTKDETTTMVMERNYGWHKSDISLQTAENELKQMMSKCVEHGPYGIDPRSV